MLGFFTEFSVTERGKEVNVDNGIIYNVARSGQQC